MAENINDAKLSDDEFYQMQKKYKETGDVRIRNNLVMQYSYIPKMAAMQMRSLAASYAQVDDMINQGMLALIDSVERFDYNKGIKFEAYAFIDRKSTRLNSSHTS